MFKQLSLKKDYLLAGSVIVLLLSCYQLAFKKTIAAWQINKSLHAQIAQVSDLGIQPAYLARKDHNLSGILERYKTDTVAFRSTIITTIALLAEKENVKLSEVPLQDPLYHTEKSIIQKLKFEGDFFSLTKLLNLLQATPGIGVVRAASYKVTGARSNNDDAKKLFLEAYLETVKL